MTYAPITATIKTPFSSLQALRYPCPKIEFGEPLQLRSPPLPRMAMAMNPPKKSRSSNMPRALKMVTPPRKQVKMTANAVYMTAAPEMPSTAFSHFGMPWLFL